MAAKVIVILIAIWSVIQGFAYGIMSILALLAHDCQIPMRQSRLTYLMYIIFFRDQKCEPYTRWDIIADVPPPNEPVWPSVTNVAYRTNILALVYLIVSSIWIITSLMLIVGCFMACLGRVTYCLFIMPWAIVTSLQSILDVVAAGFFFYDLFNTLNMDSFVNHLQMRNTATIFAAFEINAHILPIPAVIMLAVATRGFIFWCLNILSIPIVLSNARSILWGGKRTPDSIDERAFRYDRNHTSRTNNNILENHFPTTERSRYSDPPNHILQYQADNMGFQQEEQYDLSRNIGRRYVEPVKGESIDEPDNRRKPRRNGSNEDKSSKKSSWSEESAKTTSTINLAQANMALNASTSNKPNQKQYNWKEMPADTVLKIERPHFRLPNKPSLLKKLSDSSYVNPDDAQHASGAHYTGEELRSQLPWSYINVQSDAIKPKKSFVELRDDEDLPPVPVPDYKMDLSRRDRQLSHSERRTPAKKFINPKRGSSRSTHEENESRWSGPEYRY